MDTAHVNEPTYTGVRVSYRDGAGRQLYFAAGAVGDFFEDAPVAQGFRLTNGRGAYLFRYGRMDWALLWYQRDPCHQYSIGATGFTESALVDTLEASRVINSRTAIELEANV